MIKVKICGLTNEPDALAAVEAGADAVGFVVYPKSKRYVDLAANASWLRELPPFVTRVAVLVNEPEDSLKRLADLGCIDAWQFHGDETADAIPAWLPGRKIKAFRMAREFSPVAAAPYPVQAFLLDTPGETYGGTGHTFDWELAVKFRMRSDRPVILSGGLTPDNVAAAIADVEPYGVDVASGVESAPGVKDHGKVQAFLAAARGGG
jgi:phosphoribosylanthranilate isomerase